MNKWTDRLRRLEIIKEEVQKNLDEANEKQATGYNLRRRPVVQRKLLTKGREGGEAEIGALNNRAYSHQNPLF